MSPSRTSTSTSRIAIALLLCVVACGGKKDAPIAELASAEGPVDRQAGSGDWKPAAIGTGFFLGDAARTADGAAKLDVSGTATIAMQPHTVLRFGARGGGRNKLGVELGAIDLTGTGSYALAIGDVKLGTNGGVRITAKGKTETIELTIGAAQLAQAGGETIDLVIGKAIDLGDMEVKALVDAGVRDAAIDAPPDAAVVASTAATVEIVGKRAEVQAPGETAWKPLPAGAGNLDHGAKLRLGTGTTAKLVANATTLELGGGSRVAVGEDYTFTLEAGGGRASVPVSTEGKVNVPGGTVALKGNAQTPAEARIDVTARDVRIVVARGNVKLTGGPGADLEMNRGETATLARGGTIHVVEAIPTYFDFQITPGESFTVHDPRPPTAIRFNFGGKCANGGVVELDHDRQFRAAKVSAGKDFANLLVGGGSWAYRLRCTSGGEETAAVASGQLAVLRDDGTRALPKTAPTNDVDADGRTYRISYQSQVPTIVMHDKSSAKAYRLHLASGGKEETIDSSSGNISIPGSKLHEGTFTVWIDHDGVKGEKVNTLKIDFDQTAPQVYIELPATNETWAGDVDVRGAVLPGWTAAVDTMTIPIDRQRRFTAKVGNIEGKALAIRLSHPQRGVHYYLRRSK